MASRASADKKELARLLYMSGEAQNFISEKTEVSKQTINSWVIKDGWDKIRAAKNVTRPELANKVLRTIDVLLEKVLENNDDNVAFDGVADKLSKLASVIEKFDKKANVVDVIEVFMDFGRWLQSRAEVDEELTQQVQKAINKFQDLYISEKLNTKR